MNQNFEDTGAHAIVERHMPNATPEDKAAAIERIERLARTMARMVIRRIDEELARRPHA